MEIMTQIDVPLIFASKGAEISAIPEGRSEVHDIVRMRLCRFG